jgi:hypothetical protein
LADNLAVLLVLGVKNLVGIVNPVGTHNVSP